MKQSLKFFLMLTALLVQHSYWGQNNIIKINGMVRDEDSNSKLAGSLVTIYKNGGQFQTITVGENGKFKVELQLGNTYDIKFSLDTYAPKIARLETRNVPKEEQPGGYEFDMEVNLFKTPDNFNLDIMKEPAAKAIYMSETDNIGWDEAYIIKQKEKIDAEFKRIADINKADSQKKKEFDKIIQQGDEKVIKKSYEEALAKYEQAQQMFPQNQLVQTKIDQVRALMDGDEAKKKEDAKYALLLVEGDEAMNNRDWSVAQAKFNEAKKMRPTDKAPIEKLAELEKRKKENAQFSQYDSLIREGDKLMAAEKYEACIAKYKEASNILSKENYPKEQMAKARDLMEKANNDKAAVEKKNKRYQELITAGQKNIDKKDYNLALNNYQEAQEIKPSETLPVEKIEEIKRLMKEQEDALNAQKNLAQQEQANAEKRKEYDRVIKEADKTLKDSKNVEISKLNQAKTLYGQALEILPGESYPKAKDAEINALLDQLKEKMSAEQLAKQQAEEERIRKEAEWKKAQREAEEKALADQRKREEDELARKQKNGSDKTEKKTTKQYGEKTGTSAEDALDKFYREARAQRAQLIADSVQNAKREFDESGKFYTNQNKDRRNGDLEKMEGQKENLSTISSEASAWRDRRVADQAAEIEELEESNKNLIIQANKNRNDRLEDMDDLKKAQANLKINDQNRNQERTRVDNIKEENTAFLSQSESRSNARREGSERDFELQKDISKNIIEVGAQLHEQNVTTYLENKKNYQETETNFADAARSRASIAQSDVEDEKNNLRKSNEDRNDARNTNYSTINDVKYATNIALMEKSTDANSRAYEERQELMKKAQIKQPQTRPEIIQSVLENESSISERSYDLGNKKVLERTVEAGGKTYVYRKIVSTTGVYFFKNGISITEQTWKDETTKLMEK